MKTQKLRHQNMKNQNMKNQNMRNQKKSQNMRNQNMRSQNMKIQMVKNMMRGFKKKHKRSLIHLKTQSFNHWFIMPKVEKYDEGIQEEAQEEPDSFKEAQ